MANSVYIATSLDGFIAGPDGEHDWLMELPAAEDSDLGFAEFMNRIDALVMSRNTFEMVAGFAGDWPYAKPAYICSITLTSLPDHLKDKAELISGSPASMVRQLERRGFHTLHIDGGNTIHRFLQDDLIDELVLSRRPSCQAKAFRCLESWTLRKTMCSHSPKPSATKSVRRFTNESGNKIPHDLSVK